jgi:Ca2+-binding RTX toxin-like protein
MIQELNPVSRTPSSRAVRALPLVLALLAVPAAAAPAATISAEGDALVFRAAPGERNSVYLNESYNPDGRLRFEDANAITAWPASCEQREDSMVDCDVPGRVRVELGDQGDRVGFSEDYAFTLPLEVHGGDGDDALHGNHRVDASELLDGGAGKDALDGFGGDDELRGGAGDDDLNGNGGNDRVLGEDGNDDLRGDHQAAPGADVIDGGAGSDKVAEYVEYGTDVHPPADVSLDGVANDGRAGEGDNVVGVERYRAYVSGRFVLTDGAEDWEVWSNMNSGDSVVLAAGGDDRVVGSDAIETIDGGAGNDRLEGGKNHDTITGGPGRDVIFADETSSSCKPDFPESCVRYGNDTVDARDGEADQVDCGAGTDRVLADAADVVSPTCETVERGGAGAPGAGTPGGPGAAPGGPVTQPGAVAPGARMTVAPAKLRAALARGLVVRLAGLRAGRTTVTARLGRRVVARGIARITAAGTGRATLTFTRAGKRALRGKRRVTLKVSAGAATATVRLSR